MSTDPNTLLANAKCLDKCIPDGSKMGVLIYIFANLANMSTDPNTLLAGARCLNNCIPDGSKMGVLIYLATQIAAGGGGAGGGGLVGAGSPMGTVAVAGTPYLDSVSNNFWVNKDGTANGWVELIGN